MNTIKAFFFQNFKKERLNIAFEDSSESPLTEQLIIQWLSFLFEKRFSIRYYQGQRVKFKPEIKINVFLNGKKEQYGIKRVTKDSLKVYYEIQIPSHISPYYIFKKYFFIKPEKEIISPPDVIHDCYRVFNTVEFLQTIQYKSHGREHSNPFRH